MAACGRSDLEMSIPVVQLLLEEGASAAYQAPPNSLLGEGTLCSRLGLSRDTPIKNAASQPELLRLLIDAGATLDAHVVVYAVEDWCDEIAGHLGKAWAPEIDSTESERAIRELMNQYLGVENTADSVRDCLRMGTMLGARVSVEWVQGGERYMGVVASYESEERKYEVRYDDGDVLRYSISDAGLCLSPKHDQHFIKTIAPGPVGEYFDDDVDSRIMSPYVFGAGRVAKEVAYLLGSAGGGDDAGETKGDEAATNEAESALLSLGVNPFAAFSSQIAAALQEVLDLGGDVNAPDTTGT